MTNTPPTSHPGSDRLLDLALDLLPADVRQATLDHLLRCASCDKEFQSIMASHVRAEAQQQEVFALHPVEGLPARRVAPTVRPWMLAAAVAAMALGGTWFAAHNRAPSRPAVDLTPHLPVTELRGVIRSSATSSADSAILRGLDAYNRGDLTSARRLFGSVTTRGPMESVRRIYLGSLRMQQGDAEGARSILLDLPDYFVPEPWRSEARWTLAMALARSGHGAAADSLLGVLSAEEGPVAERAKALRAATPQ